MSIDEGLAQRSVTRRAANNAAQRKGHGGEAPRQQHAPGSAGGASHSQPQVVRRSTVARSTEARDRTSPLALLRPAGPAWVLIPLRVFLGVTFIYAGVQKLTDPQFFNRSAHGYIGRQIQAFAHGSPIAGLLLHLALPHAALFGALIAYGEIAIGLGALVGLLARPAAAFGVLLSLIFFLSASWNVHPYFYGADIVFVFAWITLGLAPHAGLPSVDAWLAPRLAQSGQWSRLSARGRARALVYLFSVPTVLPNETSPSGQAPSIGAISTRGAASTRTLPRRGGRSAYQRQETRRSFLIGAVTGIVGMAGLSWLWSSLHPSTSATPTLPATTPADTGASTPAAGSTAATGNVIAKVSDVPVNSAATFTIPSTGDPGVVVHLPDGKFVAFDATCTHAGCPVQFDSGSSELYCPCHGAVFDPANQAAVLQGPASTPLTPVQITTQSNGDIVLA